MPGFDPSFELQVVIRGRLLARPDLMAMISADNVMDLTGRPERLPSVIIGEGQTLYQRFTATVHTTLHVWFQEPGLDQAKTAAGLIVDALRVDAQRDGSLTLDHFTVLDMRVSDTRFLRDPHGSFSHALINVAAIVKERS
ncbi:DUF3168 domain-containing protein [Bradyrhizobium sp. Pha-3]|uniref:DUF3168 domain-containing protein n=1 Tax=Bradyrhizobium sp. Pha-3 TaxID=208375 RepID=UPI0035D3E133